MQTSFWKLVKIPFLAVGAFLLFLWSAPFILFADYLQTRKLRHLASSH